MSAITKHAPADGNSPVTTRSARARAVRLRVAQGVMLLSCTLSLTLAAQTPPVTTVPPRPTAQAIDRSVALLADSVANAGDSLAAYAMLDSAVRSNKRDASAWHRFGMLAWNMARSSRGSTFNHSPTAIRLLLAADSAMHLAVTYAPDSGAFWRDLARFYLNSGSVFTRFRAQDYVRKGLLAAEKARDSLLIADLADERGMIEWRRYEAVAHRALSIEEDHSNTPLYDAGQAKRGVKSRLDKIVESPTTFSGFAEYESAVGYFERAVAANPGSARARHHLYMAQAERKRWPDLLMVSSQQLARAPWDYEAWLARGLASQRLDRSDDAAVAFDSALTLMTPAARAEYTRVTRILPPRAYGSEHVRDSATYVGLPESQQTLREKLLWAITDPLATTAQNELQTEFYARVAYADLRWTSDDLDHRGANTDRGDIHVRYGPPDVELGLPGLAVWRYDNGLSFTFTQPPTFGTGYIGNEDASAVGQLKSEVPVSWDNVPITRRLDSVGVRVAAFRAGADSLDVVVAADIPTARMLKDSELGGALPFNISTRIIDATVQTRETRASVAKIHADSAPERLAQSWIQRVGPGMNIVRVDAFQPDTRHIARGLTTVDVARPTGFGMSDVLLGNRTSDAAAAPARWRDVPMQPAFGTFRIGQPIGLVWENYQLTPDSGDVRYRVNITVKRRSGSGVRGLVARVRSTVGNVLLGQANGPGDIDVAFPRTAPARDITVEAMTLDLGTPSPGVYELRVDVTDLVSGRKTSRVTQFQMVE